MSSKDWLTLEGVPFLNEIEYVLCKFGMECYLMDVDLDIWLSIECEVKEYNTKAKKNILKGLSSVDFDKVRHCESTKEMLGKLQCIYGGKV